ncbi:GTPase [Lipingzhangella sp. LS1_29]|uniref:GTPase n=1 Tax=Lipingzhangella rawalii TaxID=2055835 RepID=A0ABU2H6Z9_9ACTN|nr:GTP-binding protein [Lipingzhangella rawalii]MDS1271081.1 GTPase [Lipingzhangella rawalii]
MNTDRNAAHTPGAGDESSWQGSAPASRDVDEAGWVTAQSWPGDAQGRVQDRLAVDESAETVGAGHGARPGGQEQLQAAQPADQTAAQLPRRRPGANTQRVPDERRSRHRADPADPEQLADWVDSLAATAAEDDPNPAPAAGGAAVESAGYGSGIASEAGFSSPRPPEPELTEDVAASGLSRPDLIRRLDALSTLVEIGGSTLPESTVTSARRLLDQAGTRLRLSADHTVVALAGGTGSGKSSLFNALCGLDFSEVGILRPTTSSTHACVWGSDGAAPVLDWLGVSERLRHSRSSELDRIDDDLTGLILLDLPDHDSVQSAQVAEAERLLGVVDLMVWVLDPQKYADAAVHHRHLAQMSGHDSVMVTVLNQVDRLSHREMEECLLDLQRLLETESGAQPRIVTVSTLTGAGLPQLRELLVETVRQRDASVQRLGADLERLITQFTAHVGPQLPRGHDGELLGVPPEVRERLFNAALDASGLTGIAAATETAHERTGGTYVAWPLAEWVRRARRGSNRHIRLDMLDNATRGHVDTQIGTQRAVLDAALDDTARESATGLPDPWPSRVRAAARSSATELPELLDGAVRVPQDQVPRWWQLAQWAQNAVLVVAGASLLWLGTLLGLRIAGVDTGVAVLDDLGFGILAAVLLTASLAVGWLAEVGCRNLVDVAATRLRDDIERPGRERIAAIVADRVLAPIERELHEYERFRAALAVASPDRAREAAPPH